MDINNQVKELENVNNDNANKVFTMYLNTDPSDPEQQGGEWKIHLKNGLRNFEKYLEQANNEEEIKNFQTVKAKVKNFVERNEQKFRKGIILFATAEEDIWFAERVQMRLTTEFFWESYPVLDQLKHLQESFPKAGIILVQQDEIKLIDAELGEINDTAYYQLDLNTDNWRQMTGPHRADASMGSGGKSAQQDKFNARYQANKHRWYKSIAPTLDKQAKKRNWQKVFLVGDGEVATEVDEQMNKNVDQIIKKNMLDHEESKVLEEVFG